MTKHFYSKDPSVWTKLAGRYAHKGRISDEALENAGVQFTRSSSNKKDQIVTVQGLQLKASDAIRIGLLKV